jgi:phosphoribosyl-dephospho-CoA transferase
MNRLARNDLVWIDRQAWQLLESLNWDGQAREILSHWRTRSLPLVVCRQREGSQDNEVSLGLPAPSLWGRRRLALRVPIERIQDRGTFPALIQVVRANDWGITSYALSAALVHLGAEAWVYGSHGWQFLTGLTYQHAESDIDLSIHVSNFETACEVAQQLAATQLPRRLDGEIVFATGDAIAWREFHQLISGQAKQVMVKALCGIRLVALDTVCQFDLSDAGRCSENVLALS